MQLALTSRTKVLQKTQKPTTLYCSTYPTWKRDHFSQPILANRNTTGYIWDQCCHLASWWFPVYSVTWAKLRRSKYQRLRHPILSMDFEEVNKLFFITNAFRKPSRLSQFPFNKTAQNDGFESPQTKFGFPILYHQKGKNGKLKAVGNKIIDFKILWLLQNEFQTTVFFESRAQVHIRALKNRINS